MKKLLVPPLLALVLLAITASGAVAKPVTIKVVRTSSVVKAPDGTITARIAFTAKDPACLTKIPFDNSESGNPNLLLSASVGAAVVEGFQRLPVGRAVYELTLPPGTIVTFIDAGTKTQAPATQAFNGLVGAAFKNPPRPGDPASIAHPFAWHRNSKKLGRVLCVPKPERGGDFPL